MKLMYLSESDFYRMTREDHVREIIENFVGGFMNYAKLVFDDGEPIGALIGIADSIIAKEGWVNIRLENHSGTWYLVRD